MQYAYIDNVWVVRYYYTISVRIKDSYVCFPFLYDYHVIAADIVGFGVDVKNLPKFW